MCGRVTASENYITPSPMSMQISSVFCLPESPFLIGSLLRHTTRKHFVPLRGAPHYSQNVLSELLSDGYNSTWPLSMQPPPLNRQLTHKSNCSCGLLVLGILWIKAVVQAGQKLFAPEVSLDVASPVPGMATEAILKAYASPAHSPLDRSPLNQLTYICHKTVQCVTDPLCYTSVPVSDIHMSQPIAFLTKELNIFALDLLK